jgi:hypothetical protein
MVIRFVCATLVINVSLGLAQSWAETTCSITEEKKQAIHALLCGQFAAELEYKFEGPNCVEKAARKRAEDSAIQVHAYKKCDDQDFSDRLRQAILNSVGFIQVLSTCTEEKIDMDKIMDDAMKEVEGRISDERCDDALRLTLKARRSFFENILRQAEDPSIAEAIYDKLGLTVDQAGNVRDK